MDFPCESRVLQGENMKRAETSQSMLLPKTLRFSEEANIWENRREASSGL